MIGEPLKRLRVEKKLNQTDFAKYLGFNRSQYCKWELNMTVPTYSNLCLIADKLNCATDYLLGRK